MNWKSKYCCYYYYVFTIKKKEQRADLFKIKIKKRLIIFLVCCLLLTVIEEEVEGQNEKSKGNLKFKKKKDEINNNKYCFLIESIYTNTHRVWFDLQQQKNPINCDRIRKKKEMQTDSDQAATTVNYFFYD